jgi:hypothetical protein
MNDFHPASIGLVVKDLSLSTRTVKVTILGRGPPTTFLRGRNKTPDTPAHVVRDRNSEGHARDGGTRIIGRHFVIVCLFIHQLQRIITRMCHQLFNLYDVYAVNIGRSVFRADPRVRIITGSDSFRCLFLGFRRLKFI